MSRLAYADVDGDRITLHNIRNFDYRTETDFTPRWYDATFDLADLRSGDLIACYWMGDAIAHGAAPSLARQRACAGGRPGRRLLEADSRGSDGGDTMIISTSPSSSCWGS